MIELISLWIMGAVGLAAGWFLGRRSSVDDVLTAYDEMQKFLNKTSVSERIEQDVEMFLNGYDKGFQDEVYNPLSVFDEAPGEDNGAEQQSLWPEL